MKRLKLVILALLAFVASGNLVAQDSNNPWVVGFGVNTIDVRVPSKNIGDILKDYFNPEEWGDNTLPAISRISAERYLNHGFTIQLVGSLNKINTMVEKDDVDSILYYSIDANVKYDLNNAFGQTGWFDPYVNIGGGYQSIDGNGDGVLIGGLGFNTWFNDNLGLNFQTVYKHGFESTGRDVFQHSIGLVFKFGGKDTDGDGIYDKDDACPEVAGLKKFNGCPDSDGDGIIDSKDKCPNVAGLASLNGCPDADGDGVADKDDKCPNVKGSLANNGCPDTDGDGVLDKDDKCPNVSGPVANNGCPWPDTDKDGVLDKDDKCPTVAGPVSNNGCPIITKKAVKRMKAMAKTIYFNTGKSSFGANVTARLDDIVDIMKHFPKANFRIEGYTDSVGRESSNLRLSNKRAAAVKDYFISKGIASYRLSSKGFGESNPIDTNKTRAGRANNRRVEIVYIKTN